MKFFAIATLVMVLGGFAAAFGVIWYYSRDLPEVGDLTEDYRPPQTTRIETRDGVVIGEIFEERRTVVPFERIPQLLINAVLAAEDADFYQHEGLDYPGMLRALFVNVREGRMAQGASTITQQVVQTFYIGRERSFDRKFPELLLARRLEQHLTKDEILFLYLNQINFGHARYGVQEASRYYFDRNVWEIDLAQAALLAGMPRGPSVYSPRRHPDRAKARRNWVLGQMDVKEFASAEDVRAAQAAPLGLVKNRRQSRIAAEVADRVRRELVEAVGEEEAELGGYVVRTTIGSKAQIAAREAVQHGLREVDARHEYHGPITSRRRGKAPPEKLRVGGTYRGEVVGSDDDAGTVSIKIGSTTGVVQLAKEKRYNPDKLPPSRFAQNGARVWVSLSESIPEDRPPRLRLELGPQAALVALEPGTGRVVALIGGYHTNRGDFNRAIQARRQPGSTFKPIVYSLALNSQQITPATIINDAPEVFDRWRPQNYERWSYRGPVRLRQALAESINMVAVKLIRDLGPEEVVSYAGRLGVSSSLEATPALALGASAVAPIEMAEAYSVFASAGVRHEPYFVEEILTPEGRPVPLERPDPEQIIEPEEAYLITSMLRSVVRDGTARGARRLTQDAAGKTGTSNDARDAWFVGFTPTMICAVWVGFDDSRSLGRRESGSRAALPIWVQFMSAASHGQRSFERPESIEVVSIDPESGLLAYEGMESPLQEEFLEGTAPTEQAIPPDVEDPATFLMTDTGGPDAAPTGPDEETEQPL